MKILLIEDEDRGVRQAMASITSIFGTADVRVASNLDQAKEAIASEGFDFAICDIRIGSDSNSLNANESHGLAAYADLHANSPGTPAVFLSAFASVENTSDRASSGGVADAFGIADFALTQVIAKGNPEKIEAYLARIKSGLQLLDSCIVEGADLLGEMFVRAVQTYALSIDSKHARVTPMSGLSGARVGLIRYSQEAHSDVVVVIKMDRHHQANRELKRYDSYVAPRLTVGSFAPQLKTIRAGLRGMTAVISSIASPSSESLFARLAAGDDTIDVTRIKSTLSGWSSISQRTKTTLGEYRASVIGDDVFLVLPSYSAALSSLDDLEIEIAWKLSHGDLHGENILIDDEGRAVLIDFADCALLPAGVDAVALELSLLAHPKSPIDSIWPSAEFESWSDLEAFLSSSPWSTLVRDIRRWAYSESDEMQALVVYYAQACWLMKHGGPGETRMKAVALSVLSRIREINAI
jgi:hypothetical protein